MTAKVRLEGRALGLAALGVARDEPRAKSELGGRETTCLTRNVLVLTKDFVQLVQFEEMLPIVNISFQISFCSFLIFL